jgi:hypothetical protein
MAAMVTTCFEALRVYGKTAEQLESVVGMFALALADYPIEKIRTAFKVYVKRHSDLPAPADIVQIIERDGKPPFERSVYIAIAQRDPERRSSSDWAYMRDYERYAKTGAYR